MAQPFSGQHMPMVQLSIGKPIEAAGAIEALLAAGMDAAGHRIDCVLNSVSRKFRHWVS